MEARMHDFAITVLASGGKGGHRLVLVALIVVIVVLAGGWAFYAARARARGKRP
jgi:flagellar basal body-associated protein FliL